MAALDFLRRQKDVTVLHFNHRTIMADKFEQIVRDYCELFSLPLIVGNCISDEPTTGSLENYWRKQRYKFFEESSGALPVVTCHHLDDAVETWLFTSMHGDPRLIPSKRGRYLRPFLTTRKAVLEAWCHDKAVPHVFDESNNDTRFMRNYIRHEIVHRALRVNPGLHKVVRKKIIKNPVMFDEAF